MAAVTAPARRETRTGHPEEKKLLGIPEPYAIAGGALILVLGGAWWWFRSRSSSTTGTSSSTSASTSSSAAYGTYGSQLSAIQAELNELTGAEEYAAGGGTTTTGVTSVGSPAGTGTTTATSTTTASTTGSGTTTSGTTTSGTTTSGSSPGSSSSSGSSSPGSGTTTAPKTTTPAPAKTTAPKTTAAKPAPVQKPGTPGGIHATRVTATSVALAWSPSRDNPSYTVTVTYQGKTVKSATTRGTSVTVSGLSPDHTYTFHVKASNSAGTSAASNGPVVKTPK